MCCTVSRTRILLHATGTMLAEDLAAACVRGGRTQLAEWPEFQLAESLRKNRLMRQASRVEVLGEERQHLGPALTLNVLDVVGPRELHILHLVHCLL